MIKPYGSLDPKVCDGYETAFVAPFLATGAEQTLWPADSARVSVSVSFDVVAATLTPGPLKVGTTVDGVFQPLCIIGSDHPHYHLTLEEFGYLLLGPLTVVSVDLQASISSVRVSFRG